MKQWVYWILLAVFFAAAVGGVALAFREQDRTLDPLSKPFRTSPRALEPFPEGPENPWWKDGAKALLESDGGAGSQ